MSKFKRKVLERLVDDNKVITIIITPGANCCELTGCIGEVADDYLILLTPDNACNLTYIALDCICVVSERVEPPSSTLESEKAKYKITGITNISFPNFSESPSAVKLKVVTHPKSAQILYEDTRSKDDVELMLLPFGPGEVTSISYDEQTVVVEGKAQVTIGGVNQGVCDFVLEVTDKLATTPGTLQMSIICPDEEYDSGVVDLLGQSINITEC
ncbi:hypothetical protein [Natroniella sp. ANB-PHB2]|uniref:hypothetical protein n=1 Tax=Natroniella sp. ANB-PHB2 TaxID=3384444 RepID=UPI0038D385AB